MTRPGGHYGEDDVMVLGGTATLPLYPPADSVDLASRLTTAPSSVMLAIQARRRRSMGAFAAPLPAENLDEWRAWIDEVNGPRRAEFDDMNARHNVTDHRAYLQPTPDGNYLVVVVTDGPGGDSFMQSAAGSANEFDAWFLGKAAELHGFDLSAGPPPMPERVL